MESLELLHRQLGGLEDLRTIVKTMKALSGASIRQYEQAVAALGGYYRAVERGLFVALQDTAHDPGLARPKSRPGRLGAIVFGSDHGLCGRFNEDIAEYALARLASMADDPVDRRVLAVGSRAALNLEHAGQTIEEDFLVPSSAAQITLTVQQILLKVDEWRAQADVSTVHLFYNGHTGGRGRRPTHFQLLPVDLAALRKLPEGRWPSRSLPTFSMDRDRLLSRLIHQYLFVAVARACAESQASEHASRLSAMQSAERNLDDRLHDVTASYRRARQGVITAELLDVVAGFEAITAGRD
jgi:F-type H+-transporting ATPase subunit gamma